MLQQRKNFLPTVTKKYYSIKIAKEFLIGFCRPAACLSFMIFNAEFLRIILWQKSFRMWKKESFKHEVVYQDLKLTKVTTAKLRKWNKSLFFIAFWPWFPIVHTLSQLDLICFIILIILFANYPCEIKTFRFFVLLLPWNSLKPSFSELFSAVHYLANKHPKLVASELHQFENAPNEKITFPHSWQTHSKNDR